MFLGTLFCRQPLSLGVRPGTVHIWRCCVPMIVSPDTVGSRRLFGRDAWPGTWLGRPVASLLSLGGLSVRRECRRRQRCRRGHSLCRRRRGRHRRPRRRFDGT